ncbi:CMP-sialic acid transporter 4 isoform X2 [Cucumis melo var. makuwa]|uniref:CMP-sialic acid transporter 4 isoform X2 n=1 Tax=Cucumis melo var. makuwa TaxID=1194695 RepID=A0A5A7U4Z1_CUCMM|nr:CMP-sialic acid transporter 4 isoform X2 [Cucumis melo var. makuwa]TYK28300.1 CMP-sialic acid transporter 4 isoform X2 [Cucumis melo var. makuwa]
MDKDVVELGRERKRQRKQEIGEVINGGRRNEKRKIKNSPVTIWVSSPWVSVAEKKGRGDEKNGVKVRVFVVCSSSCSAISDHVLQTPFQGWLMAIIMTLLSGFAGVYTEVNYLCSFITVLMILNHALRAV